MGDKIYNWFGRQLRIRSLGMCHWEKIRFLDLDETEFYRIERDLTNFQGPENDKLPRKEFFEGKLIRQYRGEKKCFIEFCERLIPFSEKGVIPSGRDLKIIAKELELKVTTGNIYARYYKKFFLKRK